MRFSSIWSILSILFLARLVILRTLILHSLIWIELFISDIVALKCSIRCLTMLWALSFTLLEMKSMKFEYMQSML